MTRSEVLVVLAVSVLSLHVATAAARCDELIVSGASASLHEPLHANTRFTVTFHYHTYLTYSSGSNHYKLWVLYSQALIAL